MSAMSLQVSWGDGRFQYPNVVWVRKTARLAYVAACPPGQVSRGCVPVLYIDRLPNEAPNIDGPPLYQVPLDDLDLLL